MKKSILFFVAVIISQTCLAGNFKITPIMLNFKGVVAEGNTIVVFADFGSMLISRDDTESWQQQRAFEGGIIRNIFIHDNQLTAFNDKGEIAVSSDTGKSWTIAKRLGDSILDVVEYPGGYFLRMRDKLITLSPDFSPAKEVKVNSPVLPKVGFWYQPTYNRSILYADDKFIAEFDSSAFIRFDLGLTPIDTLKLLDHIEYGDYRSGYRMFSDSGYIYMMYSYSDGKVLRSSVFRTKDFINVEMYKELKSILSIYNIHNGNYFSVNYTDKFLVDSTKLSLIRSGFSTSFYELMKEFVISGEKQIIVGDRKILEIWNPKDSTLRVVSDFSDYFNYKNYSNFSYPVPWIKTPPDQVGDNTFLFYSFNVPIYKSDDGGTTILPTLDKTDPGYDKLFRLSSVYNRYYDSVSKILYLFGMHYSGGMYSTLWSSDNMGRSLDTTKIYGFIFSAKQYSRRFKVRSNFQKRGDEFTVHASNKPINSPSKDTVTSQIFTFRKDGSRVWRVIISNTYTYNYVYTKDSITFLAHSYNVIDSTNNIIHSTDGGKSWEVLHKYLKNETVRDVSDIEVNGRKYLAFIHYNFSGSINSGNFLDVVDKETNQFTRIASWEQKPEYGTFGIAIDSDGGKAYISFLDTLFVTDDLLNKANWDYYLLPEGGRIYGPLKKFGRKFFCTYIDKNNPYGNRTMQWIEPMDSLTVTGVEQTEIVNYLYSYPPYPNPARNTVRSLIYWDTANDIGKDEIAVYDIYGAKVADRKNITIEYLSAYSGYLTWDCSNIGSGLYFIHFQHGSKSQTLKVIVNK